MRIDATALRLVLLIAACAYINGFSITPSISSPSSQIYVVPSSSPVKSLVADGSLSAPYSGISEALHHVQQQTATRGLSGGMSSTINLYPTTHYAQTVRINSSHSNVRITTMNQRDVSVYSRTHDNAPPLLSRAVISGGVRLTNWTRVSSSVYSAVVPPSLYVNQLFINDKRIVRSRAPVNQSQYLYYNTTLSDAVLARYGFVYYPGQFDYKSLDDAMVVVYHSWTTSHHYIDKLIPDNYTILFTNPSQRPIGAFGVQAQKRFHIENLCDVLMPNTFCFVNKTRTVYLMTDGTYDPSTASVVTPMMDIVTLVASDDFNNPVHGVILDNIAIQHSSWSIGLTDQADGQAAAWLNPAALYIANATAILVSSVEVSHTGGYAIWAREGASDVTVTDSLITDCGAGCIRIGQMIAPVPTPTFGINIIANEVSYGGNVFPSGVAVISHRASTVLIAQNVIHHHRYTGISTGWQWGYDSSYTTNVIIQGNYIYDIGQHILNDQGGIYTLGIQRGSIIDNNIIKNVFSFAIFMWGIYLDEGSSDIFITNNIVYNTGWSALFQHYGANNTIINNVFTRASVTAPPQPDDQAGDGDIAIAITEDHMSWVFERNIIYDTARTVNRSVYVSDMTTKILFNYNVYYNPYNAHLLWTDQSMSFTEWQQTGHDVNSVIADPQFLGDVNECNFFTVSANSPAAKLGFANISRPSRWTRGCSMDQTSKPLDYNFYQW